jgi:hypothetical protein
MKMSVLTVVLAANEGDARVVWGERHNRRLWTSIAEAQKWALKHYPAPLLVRYKAYAFDPNGSLVEEAKLYQRP